MSKAIVLVFGLFFLSAAVVRCEDEAEEPTEERDPDEPDLTDDGPYVENGVLVLDKGNFDDVIAGNDIVLVEFYAPWCGHCKSLAPHYEAAAQRLKANDPPVVLGKVDATAESDLGSRFDVSGYPTLKWFKNGQQFDYDGPREEEGIVQYMQVRAKPDWKAPPEAVVTLSAGNFTDILQDTELALVEFYAPWCGHCKKLAPEFEKAAQQLKAMDPPVLLAKVDATVDSELAQKYDVTGYPTLKMFRKGRDSEYKGENNQKSIVSTMEAQVGDPSKEKDSLKKVQEAMKADDVTVIGFFASESDKTYEFFQEAVNDLREDYDISHTFDKAARAYYKVNAGSVVVFNAERFYSKYESKWNVLELKEDTQAAAVTQFIQSNNVPLVGQYNFHTRTKRYESKRPLVLFMYTVDYSFEHKTATELWRSKIVDIAKDYKDLTFAIMDEDDFTDIVAAFGFADSGEEMNVGIWGEGDKKYPMDLMEEWDSDQIREFIGQFNKGALKPRIKSQPVPKKQKSSLKTVGNSFEKVVLDKTKDVLIELYAPWCGHCKKFEPKYKALAKQLKKDKNLVLAKIDATANDVPEAYIAEGFPTIFFAPSDKKSAPVKYSGDRAEDDLIKFMTEHATVSFGKSKKDEL